MEVPCWLPIGVCRLATGVALRAERLALPGELSVFSQEAVGESAGAFLATGGARGRVIRWKLSGVL